MVIETCCSERDFWFHRHLQILLQQKSLTRTVYQCIKKIETFSKCWNLGLDGINSQKMLRIPCLADRYTIVFYSFSFLHFIAYLVSQWDPILTVEANFYFTFQTKKRKEKKKRKETPLEIVKWKIVKKRCNFVDDFVLKSLWLHFYCTCNKQCSNSK